MEMRILSKIFQKLWLSLLPFVISCKVLRPVSHIKVLSALPYVKQGQCLATASIPVFVMGMCALSW